MKELSIEEKAQRYDEAIEIAKEINNEQQAQPFNVMTRVFPELKESEDERIRKKLLSSFKGIMADADEDELWYGLPYNDIIAWLEKQGEQMLANKIQLGKKYKCIASPRYSTFMRGEIYKPEDKFLCNLMNFCSDCFEPMEDGEQKPTDKVKPKFKVGDWVINDNEYVFHVTIDNNRYQLETLEGTSCHFSYEIIERNFRLWTIQDAKDGDVLRIRNLTFIFQKITNSNVCHKDAAVAYCSYEDNDDGFGVCGPDCIIDLEIITPATKEQRDLLFSKMHEAGYEWDADKKELKKIELKPTDVRTTGYWHVEDVKQEWSEEDEEIVETLNEYVKNLDTLFSEIKIGDKDILSKKFREKVQFWLKSLKERYTWKPSDLQLECLSDAIKHYNSCGYDAPILKELLNELKKLREE